MDNRFGFKDLVMLVLLTAVLVSIWLAIKQFDRQWDDLKSLRREVQTLATLQNQTRTQVSELRQMVQQGVSVNVGPGAGATGGTAAEDDPFARVRAMRELPDFAEGDACVDAFGTQIKSVTALTYKDLYGRRIQGFVLESLADRDPDTLQFKPMLAESWEIQDNTAAWQQYVDEATTKFTQMLDTDPSPAGEQSREEWIAQRIRDDPDRPPAMVVTYKLRRDVNFSDGHPMTAHDVVYTWELLNHPQLAAPEARNFYDNVETYVALDDYTVRFACREPHYLAFEMTTGLGIMPRHFYSKFTIDDINQKPGLLMGTGPYRLPDPETWAPGELMQLVRNENYWGVRSALSRVVWREIESDVARLTAFKNGEIDLFAAQPEQYVELVKDEKVLSRATPYEYMTLPSGYVFTAWNQQREGKPTVFADRRVREAMTYLIDRQELCEQILLGYAAPTSGPFDENSPQADPDLKPRQYDEKKALELLAEAGWKRGADGVLRNAEGQPFRFTSTYPSGSETYDRIMLYVKDAMARAGVDMQLDPQQWSVFIERVDGRAFDACTLAWGGGAIEADIRQMFHSSQMAGGANNFMHYSNPELDRLIDEARRTIDEPRRMKLWQACHRILYEDQPYTFLFRRKTLRLIDNRFRNIQMVTTGMNERVEWYVPGPMQMRQ